MEAVEFLILAATLAVLIVAGRQRRSFRDVQRNGQPRPLWERPRAEVIRFFAILIPVLAVVIFVVARSPSSGTGAALTRLGLVLFLAWSLRRAAKRRD